MNTDRATVLDQLAAGQISADEAAQRLRGRGPGAGPGVSAGSRWLRIRITDVVSGKPRVNVNLPLAWVRAGLKIGARYAPEVANINLEELLAELDAGSSGKIVDVEDLDDGKRVEIYVD